MIYMRKIDPLNIISWILVRSFDTDIFQKGKLALNSSGHVTIYISHIIAL